jgi:hypothetical protein
VLEHFKKIMKQDLPLRGLYQYVCIKKNSFYNTFFGKQTYFAPVFFIYSFFFFEKGRRRIHMVETTKKKS